jgi:hypothetical protein
MEIQHNFNGRFQPLNKLLFNLLPDTFHGLAYISDFNLLTIKFDDAVTQQTLDDADAILSQFDFEDLSLVITNNGNNPVQANNVETLNVSCDNPNFADGDTISIEVRDSDGQVDATDQAVVAGSLATWNEFSTLIPDVYTIEFKHDQSFRTGVIEIEVI